MEDLTNQNLVKGTRKCPFLTSDSGIFKHLELFNYLETQIYYPLLLLWRITFLSVLMKVLLLVLNSEQKNQNKKKTESN